MNINKENPLTGITHNLRAERPKYEKYNYQKYLAINPKLTEEMYKVLWTRRWLWKVTCGQQIQIDYNGPILERVWYLDIQENHARRCVHGYPDLEAEYEVWLSELEKKNTKHGD